MTTAWNSGNGCEMGREEAVNIKGQSSFNVCKELREVRGMVSRLRGEVDIGLARLDKLI